MAARWQTKQRKFHIVIARLNTGVVLAVQTRQPVIWRSKTTPGSGASADLTRHPLALRQ